MRAVPTHRGTAIAAVVMLGLVVAPAGVARALPVANLAVTGACPRTVSVGSAYTCHVTAVNRGPGTATGVRVGETIPSSEVLARVRASAGSCKAGGAVNCTLGALRPGARGHVTVVLIPRNPPGRGKGGAAARLTTLRSTVTVTGRVRDPSRANNRAQESVRLRSPTPSGAPSRRNAHHAGARAAVAYKPAYGWFDDGTARYYYAFDYMGCSHKRGRFGYGFMFGRPRIAWLRAPQNGTLRYLQIGMRLQIHQDNYNYFTKSSWSTVQGPGNYIGAHGGGPANDFLGNNPFWLVQSVYTIASNPYMDLPSFTFGLGQPGELYRLQVQWKWLQDRVGTATDHSTGWQSVDWCLAGQGDGLGIGSG